MLDRRRRAGLSSTTQTVTLHNQARPHAWRRRARLRVTGSTSTSAARSSFPQVLRRARPARADRRRCTTSPSPEERRRSARPRRRVSSRTSFFTPCSSSGASSSRARSPRACSSPRTWRSGILADPELAPLSSTTVQRARPRGAALPRAGQHRPRRRPGQGAARREQTGLAEQVPRVPESPTSVGSTPVRRRAPAACAARGLSRPPRRGHPPTPRSQVCSFRRAPDVRRRLRRSTSCAPAGTVPRPPSALAHHRPRPARSGAPPTTRGVSQGRHLLARPAHHPSRRVRARSTDRREDRTPLRTARACHVRRRGPAPR